MVKRLKSGIENRQKSGLMEKETKIRAHGKIVKSGLMEKETKIRPQ